MAVQIIHKLLSDLSGEEADRTTKFSLDGREYSVDLTEAEAVSMQVETSAL